MKKILIIFTSLFLLLASSGINTFAEEGNIESEGTGETASLNESKNNEEDSDDNPEVSANPDEKNNQTEEDIGEETIPSETVEGNDSNELDEDGIEAQSEEDGDNEWLFLNANNLLGSQNDEDPTYSVIINWTTTNGIATISGDTYHWDASEQRYVLNEESPTVTTVIPATTTITITNKSNVAIKYSITHDGNIEEEYSSIENLIDGSASSSGTIDASSIEDGTSIVYSSSLTLTSVPNNQDTNDHQKVGTYTINITKAETSTETGEY